MNGFACGLSVNFLGAFLSPPPDCSLTFELLALPVELLLLFTFCGVLACGGVVLGPCGVDDGVG